MNSFEHTLVQRFRLILPCHFRVEVENQSEPNNLWALPKNATRSVPDLVRGGNFIFPGMHSKILANVKTLTIRGPITYIYKILNSEGISSITGRPEEISQIKSQLKKTLLNQLLLQIKQIADLVQYKIHTEKGANPPGSQDIWSISFIPHTNQVDNFDWLDYDRKAINPFLFVKLDPNGMGDLFMLPWGDIYDTGFNWHDMIEPKKAEFLQEVREYKLAQLDF